MAEEQSKDIFQSLLKLIYDILKPGLEALSDPQARNELLGTLGLESSSSAPATPGTSSLEDYIESASGEADPFKLASALADLTQLLLFLEGFFRGLIKAGDEDGEAAGTELVTAFLNLLTLDYIRRRKPGLHSFIQILSVIDTQAAASGGSVNFVKDVIIGYFKRLGKGLDDFATQEDAASVSDTLLLLMAGLLHAADFMLKHKQIYTVEIASYYGFEGFQSSTTPVADAISNRALSYSVRVTPTDSTETVFYHTLLFVPKDHGGVALVNDLSGVLEQTFDLEADKSIKFVVAGEGIFRIGEGAEAELGKNNKMSVVFEHKRENPTKWALLDKPVIKFAIGTYNIGLAVKPDDFEIKTNIKLAYQFGRGDLSGFPFDLLPENIDEKIPFGFGYSIKRNFFVDGGGSVGTGSGDNASKALAARSAGSRDIASDLVSAILNAIDLRIPIHKDIGGVIGFETIYVKTGVADEFQQIEFETSLDFWIRFGSPLLITISRLGMILTMIKREDSGGVGGYDLHPKIKPPNGAGIRVDAEVIKGGGFLYLDHEKGEYFGALELEFKGLFSLKAVGIINTKMPDGTDGFSMVILITAEFTPIQLGFGFTLLGVGGLLGLNRTMDVEAIRVGLRTNAVKSILFPEDVVGNIHRIISDIKTIFPIREDRFVIGLMGKFGWGTPTLISIELGVLLELPDPKIVILGVIKLVLPTEEVALLRIQVNFLGVIDFQNEFIYFEARLFDSYLLAFPLTGSMAFAVSWGSQSVFAISVGGFHPDFRDYPTVPTLPGAFRDMERISLQLLSGDNPRLGISCYFAVTSNSVQFGAKAELLAMGPMSFNLYGMLAFDALFIFDPFSFIISLEATLAIRRGTSILFGIHFYGKLSGPTPWHVEGEVSFSLLFFDVTIGFSATWGDPPTSIESGTEDLAAMLRGEVLDRRNWRLELPDYHNLHVTLRQLTPEEQGLLIIHPFGELVFSQHKLPLNYKIEKYGTKKPLNTNQFAFTEVTIGGQPAGDKQSEQELFAAGHYTKLKDSEKLSRKSFERLDGGFRLPDSAKLSSAATGLDPVEIEYELDYTYDDNPPPRGYTKLFNGAFSHMKRSAGVSKSNLSWHAKASNSLNQPKPVKVAEGGYALASTDKLTDIAGGYRAQTQAEALQVYQNMVAAEPGLATKIQIVEAFELAG